MKNEQKDPGSRSYLLGGVAATLFVLVVWAFFNFSSQINFALSSVENAADQLATVILSHNFKSIADIKSNYTDSIVSGTKVRILLVPGHEPDYGGAEYGSLKERDMTVELAQDLQQFLQSNSHYQVFVTRDAQSWSPIFASYFKNDWNDIIEWRKASLAEFSHLVAIGSTTRTYATVTHNTAPDNVALRLYGITKWSDENSIDIAIHIHFNDNQRANVDLPGKYSGFAIYVPAEQYGNSTTTTTVAESIFKRLAKYNPISNLQEESTGIINDPDLIAIGPDNTADAASMLIEYSYIYEPQFQDPGTRSIAIKDLAYQTYLGLQDFFDSSGNAKLASAYDTLALPHTWDNSLSGNAASKSDIFALQTALMVDGVYPPNDKSKNDCPRTGKIGSCTTSAISIFDKKYGIVGTGQINTETIGKLNALFSGSVI